MAEQGETPFLNSSRKMWLLTFPSRYIRVKPLTIKNAAKGHSIGSLPSLDLHNPASAAALLYCAALAAI